MSTPSRYSRGLHGMCGLNGVLALVAILWAPVPASTAQELQDLQLRRAQAAIDRGDAGEALELLKQKRGKPTAETLLLRSTALIMTGDTASGFRELERALKLDPSLRQGWLNLAGLEIAEQRYDAAYEALRRAQELAPSEPDNNLNLGAVRALQGKVPEAAEHFARYLEANPESAEAYYLVASNFALAGEDAEAVAHLRQAVELDERMRLRARSDDRFLALSSEEYRRLLETDVYRPPPGAHTASAAFEEPYRRGEPDLVYAVLDALKTHGIDYDPTVEANEKWALIWSTGMRIKLFTQQNGTGVVELCAPAEGFSPDQWAARTQELFRTVYQNLERAVSPLQ